MWIPEKSFKWISNCQLGILEKIFTLTLAVIGGFIYGICTGPFMGLKMSSTFFNSTSTREKDIHVQQDKLFIKTGRFS